MEQCVWCNFAPPCQYASLWAHRDSHCTEIHKNMRSRTNLSLARTSWEFSVFLGKTSLAEGGPVCNLASVIRRWCMKSGHSRTLRFGCQLLTVTVVSNVHSTFQRLGFAEGCINCHSHIRHHWTKAQVSWNLTQVLSKCYGSCSRYNVLCTQGHNSYVPTSLTLEFRCTQNSWYHHTEKL